jgi:hypothetical protein
MISEISNLNPLDLQDKKLHKIDIRALEGRYVLIIDDAYVFLGEFF